MLFNFSVSETALVHTLVQLDVPFLASADISNPAEPLTPTTLLCGLAQSEAARVRLALIPLFLKRPEFAQFVTAADAQLEGDDQTTLRCYYTAAHLLQQAHHAELDSLFLEMKRLPPLFFGGVLDGRPMEQLHQIHAKRTGQSINWLGTYHHAFQQWIRHERKRLQWVKRSSVSA